MVQRLRGSVELVQLVERVAVLVRDTAERDLAGASEQYFADGPLDDIAAAYGATAGESARQRAHGPVAVMSSGRLAYDERTGGQGRSTVSPLPVPGTFIHGGLRNTGPPRANRWNRCNAATIRGCCLPPSHAANEATAWCYAMLHRAIGNRI
jgi:hypothetical protein